MRCLTLADRLAGLGWTPRFHVDDGTGVAVPALLRSGLERRGAEVPPDPDTGWLVFDRYDWAAAEENSLRGAVPSARVLVIDDLADRAHDCDLLLDATPLRAAGLYCDRVPPGCAVLTGSAFALLRPDFQRLRPEALARRRELAGPPRRVVIALGSSDVGGQTLPWLEAVAEAFPDAGIDVVLGAAAASRAALSEAQERIGGRARLHIDTDGMAKLLCEADLAVGAGGTSAMERCCLGLPTVLLVTADNQRANALALTHSGAAVLGGPVEAAAEQLRALTPEKLAAMAAAAAAVSDGRGIARLTTAMASRVLSGDGTPCVLRPVEMADADLLYEWQCAPETRRFARNTQPPEKAEHAAWLEAKLSDPDAWFCLMLADDKPAAALRLDPLPADAGGGFEVSIHVAPGLYGRGLGRAGLSLLRALAPGARLFATVLGANQASHNLFTAAGYRRITTENYELLPQRSGHGA